MRKYKIDELPQLINIIKGEMSIVGPRPELKKYVLLMDKKLRNELLRFTPGLTDMASICFSNEVELLEKNDDPEQYYIKKIMPYKYRISIYFAKKK